PAEEPGDSAALPRSGLPVAPAGLRGNRRRPHRAPPPGQPADDVAGIRPPRLRRSGLLPLEPPRGPMNPVPFDVRDGATLIEFPEASEEDANRASVALGVRLRGMPGVRDAIPGARSLLVVFDPRRISHERLRGAIVGPLIARTSTEAR